MFPKEPKSNYDQRDTGKDHACSYYFAATEFLDVKFTDLLLAIFTIIPAWKTAGLDRATRGLQKLGFRQSRDTRQTVELAMREFVATHRPKLVVRHLGAGGVLPNTPIHFTFYVFNTGDSPAFLEGFNAGTSVVFSGDTYSLPSYRYDMKKIEDVKLLSGDRHQIKFRSEGLKVTDVIEVNSGTSILYVFGHVRYRDSSNNVRRTGFLRRYDYAHRRFSIVDDPDYEYSD